MSTQSSSRIAPIPSWARQPLFMLAALAMGAGGGLGMSATDVVKGVRPADIVAIHEKQDLTSARVDALTSRIGDIERDVATSNATIRGAANTMAILVEEVRENGKQVARMSGILEEQGRATAP